MIWILRVLSIQKIVSLINSALSNWNKVIGTNIATGVGIGNIDYYLKAAQLSGVSQEAIHSAFKNISEQIGSKRLYGTQNTAWWKIGVDLAHETPQSAFNKAQKRIVELARKDLQGATVLANELGFTDIETLLRFI